MSRERLAGLLCDNCHLEMATVFKNEDGLRQLEIHRILTMTVVDKEKNLAVVTCPDCGNQVDINLDFFARF